MAKDQATLVTDDIPVGRLAAGTANPDASLGFAGPRQDETRRIAYFVSRFPTTTETFILRELNSIASAPDVEADLYALFPTPEGVVQPAARPWLGRVRRSRPLRSLGDLARWTLRRPFRVTSSIAMICFDYRRSPKTLLRALATMPIASTCASGLVDERTEHVHAHFATYPALAAWFCHRLCGVPYSFTVHAHDLYMHQHGLERRARDAAFVVSISEFNRDLLGKLVPPSVPIHVIHCGVELDKYDFRPRASRPHGAVRALCVASLREKKGHKVLFDALASGKPGLDRISLDVVGNGELRAELESYAERLGLAGRVTFHGSLTEPDVARKLDEADLFVLPSIVDQNGDTEGIPVALMEAMAAGVPVIASRITGVPELVREGSTGMLVEPGDAADLADKLVEVIAAEDAGRDRALNARRLVEDEFELHSSADRLLELFRNEHAEPNGHDRRARRGMPSGLFRPPLVLAYHAVGKLPRGLDPEGLMVPPDEIRAQIEHLRARNYRFVTSAEFAARLHEGRSLNGICALTFDDGSVDNATVLPDLLASLDVPATLFVCPGLLGKPHPWIEPEAGVRLMDRDELYYTSQLDFIEIGAHTHAHADLGDVTLEHAHREMVTCKDGLEVLIGKPVLSFAYPYGRYSPSCPAAAEAAGYTSAATCGLQGGWTPFELRRELIAPGDMSLRFGLKARGLYRPLVSSPPARWRRRLKAARAR
jgi:colanic acid/amylovoran biosynthesis glycosyltransferase